MRAPLRKTGRRRAGTLATALALVGGIALAQSDTLASVDTLPGAPLEAAVVTAHRAPAPASEAGPGLRVVDGAFLRQQSPRSLAEAFIGVPGVWMQKTNHGGGSPFVRGLTGNQVLLLYDGIRLNNATYRYGPNQYFNTVDPFAVARAEVLLGGGAVLYGSDALGGTINLLTPDAAFAGPDGETLRPGGLVRWRSGGMERTARGEGYLRRERLAARGGVSLRDFGNLRAGGALGELVATGYDERAADVKVRLRTGARGSLTAAYNALRQTGVGRYDQVTQRGYRRYDFDPQTRQLGYLRYEVAPGPTWLPRVELTAAGQHSREVRWLQRDDSEILRREDDRVRTLSAAAVASLRPAPRWNATAGAEVYHDRVRSAALDTDLATGARTLDRGLYPARATALSYAAFAQARYARKRWTLGAGLRYNPLTLRFDDEAFGATDVRPAGFVYDAEAGYALGPRSTLHASLGAGFRAPNVNDLSTFGAFDLGVEVPSPDLRPERSLTTAIGYRRRGGGAEWQVSMFRNRLTDLIERERSTFWGVGTYEGQDIYRKVNRAAAILYGGEASVTWRPATTWRVTAQASYTYGEADGAPLRRVPPLNGRVALGYRPAGDGWFGEASALGAARQGRLSGGDLADHRIDPAGTDAWVLGRVQAGYGWGRLRASAVVDNVGDAAYRIHGSGVDGPGRQVVLEVGWGMGR